MGSAFLIAFVEERDDDNPYASPVASDLPEPEVPGSGGLASLEKRFVGALIDGLVGIVGLLAALPFGNLDDLTSPESPFEIYTKLTGTFSAILGGWFVAVTLLQAYLVTTRGQSVGKIALGTKIVTLDGSEAGFVQGVVLRSWLFIAAGSIPGIGSIVGLMDPLLIFRRDRRCLHDLVASTKVIEV